MDTDCKICNSGLYANLNTCVECGDKICMWCCYGVEGEPKKWNTFICITCKLLKDENLIP